MLVIKDLALLPLKDKRIVLTLGNFDGIHIAHREIIRQVTAKAKEIEGKSVVFTFMDHPLKVLTGSGPALLSTFEEKCRLLENLGVDILVCVPFTKEFASIEPDKFVQDVIFNLLHPEWIMVGHDYAFGKGRQGNSALLENFAGKYSYKVKEIGAVKAAGYVVSSTLIRRKISQGEVRDAINLLGRPYCVESQVIRGGQKGKNLNFRTANLAPQPKLLPGFGVYAVFVELDNNKFQGITNIGIQPTYERNIFQVEVHILNYDSDLYGKNIKVSFIEKIRDEKKFSSEAELNSQISRDIETAKNILKDYQ